MFFHAFSSLVLAATVSMILFALHALWRRKLRQSLLWSAGAAVCGGALLLLIENGHAPRRLLGAAFLFVVFLWRLRFPDSADQSIARRSRRVAHAPRA